MRACGVSRIWASVGRKLNADNNLVIGDRANVYSHRVVFSSELTAVLDMLAGNSSAGRYEKSGYVAITPMSLEFWQRDSATLTLHEFMTIPRSQISGVDYGLVDDGWNGQKGLLVHLETQDGMAHTLSLLLLNTGWITLPDRKTGLLPSPEFLSEWRATAL